MSHTIRDKQKLKARASKIQGQVVALKKMLDEPHECAAVLQQIAAYPWRGKRSDAGSD